MPTIRKIARPEREPPSYPPDMPPLTRAQVSDWVGETSLRRAAPYVGDAVFSARRTGRTLKASCQGSASQPYRVSATLAERGGVADSDCSCPVGDRCKHVAALLLTWLDDPEGFIEVESADAALERLSKPELVALVRQMLARSPELETLLELLRPAAGKPAEPVDAARIRQQVAAAFRAAGNDWNGTGAIANALAPLVQVGDNYATTGDWRNAAAVYETVARGVTEHFEEVQDEGELGDVVDECVEGLGSCLQLAGDPAAREPIVRALFDIYRWDVEFGGVGMGDAAHGVLLKDANADERRLLARWVGEAMPKGESFHHEWRRQAFGGFLLRLAGDSLDDEAFLAICRETGRRRDLVERLIQLGRIEAAAAEVRAAPDHELLELADRLHAQDQAELAERLVRGRAPDEHHKRAYNQWLRDRARERGDAAAVQALTEALFWQHPSLAEYGELQQIAQERGTWEQLRPELLRRLEREREHALLTQIHLRAAEIDRALATVAHVSSWVGPGDEPLRLQVARAAEAERPREALALYRAAVDALIKAQGRENYKLAARYLGRVRELYRREGEASTWDALIAAIRHEQRRLRALREELDHAGL